MKLKSKQIKLVVLAILASFSLMACDPPSVGSSKSSSSSSGYTHAEAAAADNLEMARSLKAGGSQDEVEADSSDSGYTHTNDATENLKLIRTVALTIKIKEDADIESTLDEIESLADDFNGYSSNREVDHSSYNAGGYVELRIPKDKVDSFLDGVEENNYEVTHLEDNLEDVTDEYIDTESRLKVKETEIERLQKYMEEADNMTDMLEIEGKLNAAIADKESYEATLQSYDKRIDLTSVKVTVQAEHTAYEESLGDIISNAFKNLGRDVLETFLEGMTEFLNFLAGAIWYILIMFILVSAFIHTIKFNINGPKRKKKKAQEEGTIEMPENKVETSEPKEETSFKDKLTHFGQDNKK